VGPSWQRELGASGLPATAISLGLAALGRPGYLNLGHGSDFDDRSVRGMSERAHAVLDAAHLAGIRYFDVARSYGRGEEFLGTWLRARSLEPGSITVGSKWGYRYTAGWQVDAEPPEVKELTAAMFRRQLGETLSQLGPYLALYQIHSATISSRVLEDEDVLAELEALRRSGIRVGLTVSGSDQAATIRRAVQSGAFDTVQATWNLLEPSAGGELEAAHDAGMGVIIKEALANGRLTARGGIEPLARAAAHRGVSQDALAIAAALARPWVDTVLSGASTVSQLVSNLAATGVTWDDQLERELAVLTEPPDRYWAKRAELHWT
jgi:aryl-alcohol dehydrogenase-like predicted oxidoreductase